MRLNIDELRDNCVKFDNLISEYMDNFNNYYNEINFIHNYWSSPKANYFLFVTDKEKLINKNFYFEMLSLYSLFKFIVSKYSNIKKLSLSNSEGVDLILNKILNNKIDRIVSKYDSIYSNYYAVQSKVNYQKNKIKNNKVGLFAYKDEVKKYYSSIKEIESEIKYKISQISIEDPEVTSKENKTLGDSDTLYHDVVNLNAVFEKMKKIFGEFEKNRKDLEEVLNNLYENYNSPNSKDIKEIIDALLLKYDKINMNFSNNINLLNENIHSMEQISSNMKDVADNIVVSENE